MEPASVRFEEGWIEVAPARLQAPQPRRVGLSFPWASRSSEVPSLTLGETKLLNGIGL